MSLYLNNMNYRTISFKIYRKFRLKNFLPRINLFAGEDERRGGTLRIFIKNPSLPCRDRSWYLIFKDFDRKAPSHRPPPTAAQVGEGCRFVYLPRVRRCEEKTNMHLLRKHQSCGLEFSNGLTSVKALQDWMSLEV